MKVSHTYTRAAVRSLAAVLCLVVLAASATVNAASPYIAPPPDKQALQALLLAGHYAELEQRLGALQRGYESGAHSDWPLLDALSAFASTNPQFAARLEAWVGGAPDSALARTAHAIHLVNLGWTARGVRYANKTSDEQFARMAAFFERARAELREALARAPALSVASALELGMAKADMGMAQRRKLVRAALQRSPRSFAVRYHHLFGLQPRWGGSPEEMQAFVNETRAAVRANPALTPLAGFGHYAQGVDLFSQESYQDAERRHTQALAEGEFALYYSGRGRAREKLGRLDEALADFNRALALEPDDAVILRHRANALVESKQFELALTDLELALQLDPLDPLLLRGRARLFQRYGRPQDALRDYRMALTLDPGNAGTYAQMGALESGRKDYRAASGYYQQAAELEPDRAEYWYEFASAMYYRKECEVRYPLVRFQKLCTASSHKTCTEQRLRWAEKTLRFVRSNPACANITDDSRPEPGR